MKKFWIQIFVLIFLTLGALVLTFNGNLNFTTTNFSNPPAITSSQLKIADTTVNIEVASTPDARSRGLSGRDSLDPNSGMLFTFDKSDKYSFWMKDMKFSLDFIWINSDMVVDLLANVPAPAPNQTSDSLPIYQPVTLVDKVLEVNAGFITSHGIKVGDKIQLINP